MSRDKQLIVLLSSIPLFLTSLCSGQAQQKTRNQEPRITDVRLTSLPSPTADHKVTFELAIAGENLPEDQGAPRVSLDTKDPASPVSEVRVISSNNKEIRVGAIAKVPTDIIRVIVSAGNRTVETTSAWTISIKDNPPMSSEHRLKQFEIGFTHEKNKEFPDLHSLLITNEGADGGFADNPHWMAVDLAPTGATDVRIVQTNYQQLDLHFVAAADYEPKSVVITVYDGSDLDKRVPVAVSVERKSPPADSNQPTISGTEIVFINRHQGVGRIRIYGKGFGDYNPPPYSVDEYLWNCLERPYLMDTADSHDLAIDMAFSDANTKAHDCAELANPQEPLKPWDFKEQLKKDELKQRRNELEKTAHDLIVPEREAQSPWKNWEHDIKQKVSVGIGSRNPDIRVETVEILGINDKMIDVYFEFTRYAGYALPFRLGDSTITIKKMIPSTTQTLKNDKVTGTVTGEKQETYAVPYQPGPKPNPNLSYKYTVLDKHSANTLLGRGIAENFRVLQLSVVNNGEKKITIPLSAIEAEVEWVRGKDYKSTLYLQGPPTITPFPLAAVSAYFDAYQKVKGSRAILFNALDAATIMATALVPFTGPSLKDATVFFSGGFVPGVRKGWGDLSGQQLQNLTALSWESSETLAAKGGSIEKLVYIPENDQIVGKQVEVEGQKNKITRRIASIMDVEVTGFEVVESEAKQATPAAPKRPATGTTSSPSQETPEPSKPNSPVTPAQPKAPPKGQKKP